MVYGFVTVAYFAGVVRYFALALASRWRYVPYCLLPTSYSLPSLPL